MAIGKIFELGIFELDWHFRIAMRHPSSELHSHSLIICNCKEEFLPLESNCDRGTLICDNAPNRRKFFPLLLLSSSPPLLLSLFSPLLLFFQFLPSSSRSLTLPSPFSSLVLLSFFPFLPNGQYLPHFSLPIPASLLGPSTRSLIKLTGRSIYLKV